MKDLTIIVQTKNRPRSLERLLVSLFSSLKEPTDIHIWDGGENAESVPEVRRIAEIMTAVNHRLFFIKCGPLSLAEARHGALKAARTRYIYMLDDDVIVTRTFLDLFPFDGAFICPYYALLPNHSEYAEWFDLPFEDPIILPYTKGNKRVRLLYAETGACLVRRDDALAVGGFKGLPSFGEVWGFNKRLKEKGYWGDYEPRAMVYHNEGHLEWVNPEFRPSHEWPKEILPYLKRVR